MLLGVSLDLKYFVNQDFKGLSLQNDRTATKALRIFLQATFSCFMYKEIHIPKAVQFSHNSVYIIHLLKKRGYLFVPKVCLHVLHCTHCLEL